MTYGIANGEFLLVLAILWRGQNSVPATELFRDNGDITRGKLSL